MAALITSGRVTSAPANVYYLPDYITPEEERALVDKVPGQLFPTYLHSHLDYRLSYMTGPTLAMA